MGLGIDSVTFDCRHPATLARFWAEALGWEVAPYDEPERQRLRARGITDPEEDPSVQVDPPEEGLPVLFFTKVPETKAVKNRVHLDLAPDTSMVEEVERLVRLGASILEARHDEDGDRWTVMLDPEGNELCVMAAEEDDVASDGPEVVLDEDVELEREDDRAPDDSEGG